MNWYVVQAYSGYEMKVRDALIERINLAGLKEKFGEILVPTEQVVELKSGEKKKTERKFFPGYIIIEMDMDDDTWQLVKHTPRISTFVGGTKEKPMPISKQEVEKIINRIEVGEEAPRPKTLFEPGEVVRVCDGPFNDFNGVVEEVDYENSQANIMMYLFFVYCKSKGLVYTKENLLVFLDAMYKDHRYFKPAKDHSLFDAWGHENIEKINVLEYEEAFHLSLIHI
mgnify:CR=1 FL=1